MKNWRGGSQYLWAWHCLAFPKADYYIRELPGPLVAGCQIQKRTRTGLGKVNDNGLPLVKSNPIFAVGDLESHLIFPLGKYYLGGIMTLRVYPRALGRGIERVWLRQYGRDVHKVPSRMGQTCPQIHVLLLNCRARAVKPRH